MLSVTALSLLIPLVPVRSGGSDWPQFRGPDGTGAVRAADIPLEWSAEKNLAWSVKLPGQGWSQPVVVGGTVYVTAALGETLETPIAMEAGIADPRTQAAGAVPAHLPHRLRRPTASRCRRLVRSQAVAIRCRCSRGRRN